LAKDISFSEDILLYILSEISMKHFVGFAVAAIVVTTVAAAKPGTTKIPSVTIGQDVSGKDVEMPLVGAGTWQYNDTVAYNSVCKAIQAGYTLIDTAWGYKNQIGVGLAIKDCWTNNPKNNQTREDLFVLTKIPGGLTAGESLAMLYQNLFELQLDYVDHVMVHFPSDWEQKVTGKQQRQEQWKALEDFYKSGKARSIGISHYCPNHIDDILEIATVRPSLNQVEYHVGSQDVDQVMEKCTQENIYFMSFSPLCGPCQADKKDSLITGDLVTEIASHYPNKTGSQVALRFIVQQSIEGKRKIAGVIPKSDNPKHLASNLDVFDFALTDEDMKRLAAATTPAAEAGDCDVP